MDNLRARRREMLVASLMAALPAAFTSSPAEAAGVDPSMTIVRLPDQISWAQLYNFPPGAAEQAPMFGKISEPGQYFVLIRWHPGYMSAPHWYETDRLCVVLSERRGFRAAERRCRPGGQLRAPGRADAAL